MKKRLAVISIMVAIISGCTMHNVKPEKMPKGVEISDSVFITAEVVAIDKADRTITLLGSDGNILDLEVDESARNFNQVKVGDMLKAEFYESVAIYIGKK